MTIPVVFTSSNEFAPYLSIAITSIMENKYIDTVYDFYVLVPNDFSEKNKRMMQADYSKYTNYTLNFIDMGEAFASARPSRWGRLIYYKLLLAEILPVDRCLNFGADVLVNVDLTELFNTDIGDNYFAAVQMSTQPYYNVDSMIVNLAQIRAHKLTKVFCDNIEKYSNEERILNAVCAGHIYRLPYKYNVLMHRTLTQRENFISLYMSETERREGETNPAVMHYIGSAKPWYAPSVLLHTDRWWYYARKSVFYEMIQQNLIINMDKHIVDIDKHIVDMDKHIVDMDKHIVDMDKLKTEFKIFIHRRTIFLSYYRYKFLSVTTFGKKRKHYKKKRDDYYILVRKIRNLLRTL